MKAKTGKGPVKASLFVIQNQIDLFVEQTTIKMAAYCRTISKFSSPLASLFAVTLIFDHDFHTSHNDLGRQIEDHMGI